MLSINHTYNTKELLIPKKTDVPLSPLLGLVPPVRGVPIGSALQGYADQVLGSADKKDMIEAHEALRPTMSPEETAKEVLKMSSEKGWGSELLQGTDIFKSIGYDPNATPEQIESEYPEIGRRRVVREQILRNFKGVQALKTEVEILKRDVNSGKIELSEN